MAERIVSMHAAHRSGKEVIDGFLSRPSSGKQWPAIVLVHGYRGLDDGQRAVTRRFAQKGFVCLSPDLFHGRTYDTLEGCALKKTSLDIPRAVNNIVDSAVSFQSLFPEPEDLKGISAPMLCHYGTHDPGTTKTEVEMFSSALETYKKKYQIERYAGAG